MFCVHSSNYTGTKKMEPLKLDKKNRRPIFLLYPMSVEMILDEKNWSLLIESTKPLVCRFFSNPCESPTACHNATKKSMATPSQQNKLQHNL